MTRTKRQKELRKRERDPLRAQTDRDPAEYMRDGGWSEHFAFIAGFTSWGFPYGTTWEEKELMEQREAELARIRQELAKRVLHVDMTSLEEAFDSRDSRFSYYLDTETGACLALPGHEFDVDISEEMQADIDLVESAPLGRLFPIDSYADVRPSFDEIRKFVFGVNDQRLRGRMNAALGKGRGAYRRFLDLVHEEAGEVERWHHFRRQRLRENIAAYLASEGVTVTYDALPDLQPRNDSRRVLLEGAVTFIERVKRISGVERVALIGSLTTVKAEPNDVDLLLTIATTAIAPQIATAGRKLKGHALTINRGADVFLADTSGAYLGRTCPWRECEPGRRMACDAQNCGTYVYDDFHVLKLGRELIAAPPLEIWPTAVGRGDVPDDVLEAFGINR